MPETIPSLYGLVLTGGRSTRMGVDKSTINYHGKPQREYLYDRLATVCDQVFLSVNADQLAGLTDSRFRSIPDAVAINGPLAGILSAFQSSPEGSSVAWLVVVCDLPLLSEHSIRKLIAHRQPAKLATAFWDSDHRYPEPSVCIWEPRAYGAMQAAVAAKTPYPRGILMANEIELVDIDDVQELTNANDPADAQIIQQRLKQ